MDTKLPKCSVIILNYFGEKVIGNVINSLQNLNYPKDKLEIIVVDNNSQDKSPEIIKNLSETQKNLEFIPLKKNLGFSKGNNVGIKNAQGEYIALLNNDCVVAKNWLSELVKTALNNPRTFAVASKILLYQKYLKFGMKLDPRLSHFYSNLSSSNLYNFTKKRIYFSLLEKNGTYIAEIPYDPVADQSIEIEIGLNLKKETSLKNISKLITLPSYAKLLKITHQKKEVHCKISINLKSVNSVSKIQNAGIIPFQDGYARDIGAIVNFGSQYYEYDEGQYDSESEVYAFCGAAVLLNKKILDSIGLLDETFFMYYEDVELSERARLNNYKIYYSPKAEVRHIHALSSKEGSKFFVYHVEKGRLLHVLYSFPLQVFYKQFIKTGLVIIYGAANILISLKYLKAISKDKSQDKPNLSRPFHLSRVLGYFVLNLPYLLCRRYFTKHLPPKSVTKNMQEITSGRWYFN